METLLKWLVGLCVIPLWVSCAKSDQECFTRLVTEWEGKEIKFPSHSVFTIQGKDTVDFEFRHADYKVVMYVDSVGCTDCKLQLSRWKELVMEIDSLTGGNVSFLFYFYPKDIKALRYILRRDAFTYPICLDEQNELDRLNDFPSDMTFQTLLLDKSNKVVAIGNPVLNPNIKELYIKLITGIEEVKSSVIQTQVSVSQTVVDFGKFSMKEKKEHCFALTNMGNNMLVVQDIITSCRCTKAEYSKEPIRPGGTLEVKVIYEADELGHFNKNITVYCNAEKSPLQLTVKGEAF